MGQSGATCSSLIGIRYERFAIVENLELCAGDSAPLHAETSVDSFLSCWFDLGSSKCYFQTDGAMSTGWADMDVAGKTMHYYFNQASGNLVRNIWFQIDVKTYFFRPSGNLVVGWATIADKKYYLDELC